jgi:hypothetical protein
MRRTLKFLVAAAAATVPALAGAQQVNFVGSTLGCFYQGPGGSCAPSLFSSVGTLSYAFGTFNIFTDPAGSSGTSFGAVGNSATLDSHGSLTSAGTFTSSAGANQYFLRLETTVTSPALSGSVFTNDFAILGSTANVLFGGLHFTPLNPLLYAGPFTNGVVFGMPGATASGTVDSWTYDNQSLTSGRTVFVSSFLQITSEVSAVPEPATVTLMATGLLALVGTGFMRRRNNA